MYLILGHDLGPVVKQYFQAPQMRLCCRQVKGRFLGLRRVGEGNREKGGDGGEGGDKFTECLNLVTFWSGEIPIKL